MKIPIKYRNQIIYTLIDNEDCDKIKDFYLNISTNKNNFYVTMYRYINKIRYNIALHRYIMDCPENMVVDHINHNTLNNCKYNLRICT